jgi:signal transduction histidine kinase
MPALAKPPVRLPRFVPHITSGANAGAGSFSYSGPNLTPADPQNSASHTPESLAHDARNVLSGLMLYCDLLSAPGVLARQHRHYAQELETIARSAAQILEKLVEHSAAPQPPGATSQKHTLPIATHVPLPSVPVTDAAAELRHLQPLLAAIAGPAIQLAVATMPCPGRTALAVEDFTRILVNLVRNAADAMPAGGRIRLTAQYGDGLSFLDTSTHTEDVSSTASSPQSILIAVADNGSGIPESLRNQVFDLGFTTRQQSSTWPAPRRRGLGLSIVRNLVEAAGGTVRVCPAQTRGTCFEITLPLHVPVTSGMCSFPPQSAFAADSSAKGCIECQ